MHRLCHFLGLNVLILVQNQLFKHCVGCVFSSSPHCLCHCVLHSLHIFPGSSSYAFALFCSLLKSLQDFHSISYTLPCNLYFNNPIPSSPPSCSNFYFPVHFVSRMFHIIIFIPLCFLLLVKQFSVLPCRITLYDYQAMCRTNKESSDSAQSLLDVSTAPLMSIFPSHHQRQLLKTSQGRCKTVILIWNAYSSRVCTRAYKGWFLIKEHKVFWFF